MRGIEQLIREVNGSMAMEGMPLTDTDKENMRAVLRGEFSFDEMRRKIIADYKPKQVKYDRV